MSAGKLAGSLGYPCLSVSYKYVTVFMLPSFEAPDGRRGKTGADFTAPLW